MAEICLDCYNQENHTALTEREVRLLYADWEICEWCGQLKPCVLGMRSPMGRLVYDLRHGMRGNRDGKP